MPQLAEVAAGDRLSDAVAVRLVVRIAAQGRDEGIDLLAGRRHHRQAVGPTTLEVFLNQVRTDRLCNAVGGYEKYGGPLIIVDFGTATTFDIVLAVYFC